MNKKIKKISLSITFVLILLGALGLTTKINAIIENPSVKEGIFNNEETILDNGNHGIDWRLTTDGVLYLGEGTLQKMEGLSYRKNYPWSEHISKVKKVVIEAKIILPENPRLFTGMSNLLEIENVGFLDTSRVTDMSSMFYSVVKLKELDLSNWDTCNVTSMKSMFENTPNLTDINLGNWNVSKVENMNSMFRDATSLETLDLENWDVSKVNDMTGIFATIFTGNSKLTNLNISTWDVSNVNNMSAMFSHAKSLKSLDISGWDVSNVRRMASMFSNASGLVSLDLSNWNTSNVESMSYMFQRADKLINLDLSGWDVSKVAEMKNLLEKSRIQPSYEVLNLSNWNLSGITDLDGLFSVGQYGKRVAFEVLNLSDWNSDKLYNFDFLRNIEYINTLKLNNWTENDELISFLHEFSDNNYINIIGLSFDSKDMKDLSYSHIAPMIYNGTQLKPDLKIYDGEYKLIEGIDYEINYGDNINSSGGGYIYIEGKRFYNKEKRKYNDYEHIYFDILPAKLKLVHFPKASTVYRYSHLSESTISGGKVVNEFGLEENGSFYWDWNNIENQSISKDEEFQVIYYMEGNNYYNYEPLKLKLEVKIKESVRLGGSNREATAVIASQKAYPKRSEAVVLAGFGGDVDALTGTLLAADKDAPLLITRKSKLSKTTKEEIKRLGASKVFILGGENVITNDVTREITSMGINVTRIEGANRNSTAVQVAKIVKGNISEHAFIALGRESLADALAIGPVSAKNSSPVLLVEKDRLPKETSEAIIGLKVKDITIVGGLSAVSAKVEKELKELGVTVTRVYGNNREKTATKIAETYFADFNKALIANGRKSADALVGGYLGKKLDAPILLTNNDGLTKETNVYIKDRFSRIYVLGGELVISERTFKDIELLLK